MLVKTKFETGKIVKMVIIPENEAEKSLLTAMDENGINLKTQMLLGLKEGSNRNVRLSSTGKKWITREHQ